jgi:hypothetical protein
VGPAAVRLHRCGRSRRGRGRAVRETFPAIHTNASLYWIAAQWNRTGVKTNSGNTWTGRSVKQMMLRPRYAGLRFYLRGNEKQNVTMTGRVRPMVAQQFAGPPTVDILVNLRPHKAKPVPLATLLFNDEHQVRLDPGWPLKCREPAGIHKLRVDVHPPLQNGDKILFTADPPGVVKEVTVS